MKDHKGRIYNFEGMNIGDERYFPCKKSDRDRLRNSLQTAARYAGISVSTKIDDHGITYTRIVPKKELKEILNEEIQRV